MSVEPFEFVSVKPLGKSVSVEHLTVLLSSTAVATVVHLICNI